MKAKNNTAQEIRKATLDFFRDEELAATVCTTSEVIKNSAEEIRTATLDFFRGDELAALVWVSKYGLKDAYGDIYHPVCYEKHTLSEIKPYLKVDNFWIWFFRYDTYFQIKEVEQNQQLLYHLRKSTKSSIRAILNLLFIYTANLIKSKYALLRRVHFQYLSIFFGLCCSSPGYIFNAITGTSSYPCPVKH